MMMQPRIHWIDSCQSTNTYLAQTPAAPHGTVVATVAQTAGRGQRGNTWEAEPGANLTFSMLLRPKIITARRQFELSMLVALAIADAIRPLVPPEAGRVAVKWPNDIYVGDRKIAGILIENTLAGATIDHSIIGVGLNVNQTIFRSDAPNPVSLAQLTGRTYKLPPLLSDICHQIATACNEFRGDHTRALTRRYIDSLWHGIGRHPYIEARTGERFEAEIVEVDPTGIITLRDTDSHERRYAFKEVVSLIS